ncbi:hypothetical protein HYC85_004022 [Camellia sinensis]|uniref:Arginine decarboxylase n=1 Tax=Camellia sinensis TaxID=4442 RepID=A0A7J7HWJ9_CAMSI|nr:hypothetical protein HYC85_004022 [Camellia sinensis]
MEHLNGQFAPVDREDNQVDVQQSNSLKTSHRVVSKVKSRYITIHLNPTKEKSIIDLGKKQDKKSIIENIRTSTKDTSVSPNSQKTQVDGLPPLVSALKASAEQNAASFHFPGHNRGKAAPSSLSQLIGTKPFLHDLPELPELDNLFSPEGPILEAQKQAAKLFGASETWFLVGGTTCGIQAAIMATCFPGDSLILPRNSHISALSAMVLSGAIPKYIIPEHDSSWDIAEKAIEELDMEGRKIAAVFVTSPTYHGICSNLSEISKLCHLHKIPLIVDEAHGAHLGFHPDMPYPALRQGADLAVQSTHKIEKESVDAFKPFKVVAQTAARAQLSENPETVFNEAVQLAVETKNMINKIPGISVLDFPSFSNFPAFDPLRLNIGVWLLGLSGFEADELLYRDYGVVSELTGTRAITLAINLGTCREHVQRLVSGLRHLSTTFLPIQGVEGRVDDIGFGPREAFFASKRKVSVRESVGEVCGELICPYPPGIPVLIPGEVITENALNYLMLVRSKGAVISGAADPLLSSILEFEFARKSEFVLADRLPG